MTSFRASSSKTGGSKAEQACDPKVSTFDDTSMGISSYTASAATLIGAHLDVASDVTQGGASSVGSAVDSPRRSQNNPASKGKGLKEILKKVSPIALRGSQPGSSRSKRKVPTLVDGQYVYETGYRSDMDVELAPGGKRSRGNPSSGIPSGEESDSNEAPVPPTSKKTKGNSGALSLADSSSDDEPLILRWNRANHRSPRVVSDSEDDMPISRIGTGRKAFPRVAMQDRCDNDSDDSIGGSSDDEPLILRWRKANHQSSPRVVSDPEDDMPICRVGTGRKAFSRVVVQESHEESSDSIDSDAPLLRKSKGKGKADVEHSPVGVEAEDQALVDIPADWFDAEDEEDEEVAEYVPGPDDIEEEEGDDDKFAIILPYDYPLMECDQEHNEKFVGILRKCLDELADWSHTPGLNDWINLPLENREMTIVSRRVVALTSVDFLMKLFLPAFSIEVQKFVAGDEWTLEAILALSDTIDDSRPGIYGNFPTDGPGERPEIGCEAYIGSAADLHSRNYAYYKSHAAIASNYSLDTLPDDYKKSLHYRDICRPGVQNNFRKLAAFDVPIPRGYLNLLESVIMILFGTYTHRRYHRWASEASYDLVEKIRSSLESSMGLPKPSWKGLNGAWPLFQGIYNPLSNQITPCGNEACGAMTYPMDKTPEGQTKRKRYHLDPRNPLGPYICPTCSIYRMRLKKLPNAEWCEKNSERFRFRKENGFNVACECCGLLESQFPELRKVLKDKKPVYRNHRHYTVKGWGNKRFCGSCRIFIETKGRMRTADETLQFLAFRQLGQLREMGADIICDHCDAVEGQFGSRSKHHTTDGMLLCERCRVRYKRDGHL